MPKAYEPEQGYKYQILCKYNNEAWEHCDYARDNQEKHYLINEYRIAYGRGFTFKTIRLPIKYHNAE